MIGDDDDVVSCDCYMGRDEAGREECIELIDVRERSEMKMISFLGFVHTRRH